VIVLSLNFKLFKMSYLCSVVSSSPTNDNNNNNNYYFVFLLLCSEVLICHGLDVIKHSS
jgi:hypothetical protein